MFDGLSIADNGGVQYLLVLDLARHLIGFFDQPIDGRAIDALRTIAVFSNTWLPPGDLAFGLA